MVRFLSFLDGVDQPGFSNHIFVQYDPHSAQYRFHQSPRPPAVATPPPFSLPFPFTAVQSRVPTVFFLFEYDPVLQFVFCIQHAYYFARDQFCFYFNTSHVVLFKIIGYTCKTVAETVIATHQPLCAFLDIFVFLAPASPGKKNPFGPNLIRVSQPRTGFFKFARTRHHRPWFFSIGLTRPNPFIKGRKIFYI